MCAGNRGRLVEFHEPPISPTPVKAADSSSPVIEGGATKQNDRNAVEWSGAVKTERDHGLGCGADVREKHLLPRR
jgi:hypothetical protein